MLESNLSIYYIYNIHIWKANKNTNKLKRMKLYKLGTGKFGKRKINSNASFLKCILINEGNEMERKTIHNFDTKKKLPRKRVTNVIFKWNWDRSNCIIFSFQFRFWIFFTPICFCLPFGICFLFSLISFSASGVYVCALA